MSESVSIEPGVRGSIQVGRLLPPESVQSQGHPKLVALLMGEDCARGSGRPNWGELQPLPGVWQDLARMNRRLHQLGFGKVAVLAGDRSPGSRETFSLSSEEGVEGGPTDQVELVFSGPATRAAINLTVERLREHLIQNHMADDGQGGEVLPLFLFYYSGHGFVNLDGVHCLPLADSPAGEQTGQLLDHIMRRVGADDPSRGSAGGGSCLSFLDCCQAGQVIKSGAKGGRDEGGVLESQIMDAIRAGRRRGRFLVGSSLGDEQAREGVCGGYFTQALCASLVPEVLGRGFEEEATLSLKHLTLSVDRLLQQWGGQIVSRFPSSGDMAWDNYVLFSNPHYQPPRELLRFHITTDPREARLLAEEEGEFRELEQLSGGWELDRALSQPGRRVYQVPESWQGRMLRLRAEPVTTEERVAFEPSLVREVYLAPDPTGTPPMIAMALQVVRQEGETSVDADLARAETLFVQAQEQTDRLEQYRGYQAALALLQDSSRLSAKLLKKIIEEDISSLKEAAGVAFLEQQIEQAKVLAQQHRYREAYGRLALLQDGIPELQEFELEEEQVDERLCEGVEDVLSRWQKWAEDRRQESAEMRLEQGAKLLAVDQPWQSWRRAFEAEVLVGESERIRGLKQQSQTQAINDYADTRLSLEALVGNGAHGILIELLSGEGPFTERLQHVLKERYGLDIDQLNRQTEEEQAQFRERHADWFPPEEPLPLEEGLLLGGSVPSKEALLLESVSSKEALPLESVSSKEALPLEEDLPVGALLQEEIYPGVEIEFVYIQPGKFTMGSEQDREDEKPSHEVEISRGFYLGRFQVTQGQWEGVMGDHLSHFKGKNRPVEKVSWKEIQSFMAHLNESLGEERYRLPTEAEWEYACRAGTTTTWSWGEEVNRVKEYAWCLNSRGRPGTHPVGELLPNPWGLYDMHGNVWEWVSDGYDEDYYGQSPDRDPPGPSKGKGRVLRGGSWNRSPSILRASYRLRSNPDDRSFAFGFRCAISNINK